MDKFAMKVVRRSQEYKTKKLSSIGKFLLKQGVSANAMTFVSLLFGLLAVYYLFTNNLLFVIFILLHLAADAIDGVLARLTTVTMRGKFLDHILSDGLVTILPIFKIGWFLGDVYAYLVAIIFTLALVVYAVSRFQAPIVFMRMYVVVALFISLLIYPFTEFLLVLTYLSVVVAGGYSLARQLQWFCQKLYK